MVLVEPGPVLLVEHLDGDGRDLALLSVQMGERSLLHRLDSGEQGQSGVIGLFTRIPLGCLGEYPGTLDDQVVLGGRVIGHRPQVGSLGEHTRPDALVFGHMVVMQVAQQPGNARAHGCASLRGQGLLKDGAQPREVTSQAVVDDRAHHVIWVLVGLAR